jgi:hypothetical protein
LAVDRRQQRAKIRKLRADTRQIAERRRKKTAEGHTMPSSAMANIALDSGRHGELKIGHTRLLLRPLRRDNLETKENG